MRERLGATAPRDALPLLSVSGRKRLIDDGVDRRSVDELWHLHERGDAYSVYIAPAT